MANFRISQALRQSVLNQTWSLAIRSALAESLSVAVDDRTANVDRGGGVGVSIQIGERALGSQSGEGSSVELEDAVDGIGKVGQLDGAGNDLPTMTDRGRAEESGNVLVGVISAQSDSSIGTALIIGKSHGDIVRVTGLEGSRGDRGDKESADSDDGLHFVGVDRISD